MCSDNVTIRVSSPIVAEYVNPPIPFRGNDWIACREGQEEDGPHGYGRTKADAIRNLLDNED